MSDHTSAPTAPTSPTSIVYITSRWGEPSQTFVRREAFAVRSLGVEVTAMSLKRPGPEGREIDAVWLSPPLVVLGVVQALVRRPRAVASVFGTILRCRVGPRNLASHLGAAAIGVAWVGRGVLPAGHLHSQFGWVAATANWAAARVADRTSSVMLHAFEIHDERYQDRFTGVPLQSAQVFVESEQDRRIVGERWDVEPTIVRLTVGDHWLDPSTVERQDDLVVSVGRLVEKKGFDVLLEALARAEHPWRCEIVGDGPLDAELRAQVAALGLTDRVTLLGARREDGVRDALHRAAVMALASVETATGDRDGTPTVIVEAMACGAVVVSTDAGAIAEQVADAGIVVGQRDPAALAAALDRVADPAVRAALAEAGAARVRDGWTASSSARRLLDLLAT